MRFYKFGGVGNVMELFGFMELTGLDATILVKVIRL